MTALHVGGDTPQIGLVASDQYEIRSALREFSGQSAAQAGGGAYDD